MPGVAATNPASHDIPSPNIPVEFMRKQHDFSVIGHCQNVNWFVACCWRSNSNLSRFTWQRKRAQRRLLVLGASDLPMIEIAALMQLSLRSFKDNFTMNFNTILDYLLHLSIGIIA